MCNALLYRGAFQLNLGQNHEVPGGSVESLCSYFSVDPHETSNKLPRSLLWVGAAGQVIGFNLPLKVAMGSVDWTDIYTGSITGRGNPHQRFGYEKEEIQLRDMANKK